MRTTKLCRVVALACAIAACLSVPTASIDSSNSRKSESGRGKSLLRSGATAHAAAQVTTHSEALPPQTASSVATCPPEDVAELSENEFEQVFKINPTMMAQGKITFEIVREDLELLRMHRQNPGRPQLMTFKRHFVMISEATKAHLDVVIQAI